jgi:hypothetical protein
MSFRTIGWFGPQCPQKIFSYQIIDRMKLSQNSVGDDFPLELAMKIFWEAATFQIVGSVTTQNGTGSDALTVTNNVDHTFDWGAWTYSPPNGFDRPTATKAHELLCRDYHTLYDAQTLKTTNGANWSSWVRGFINRAPFAPLTYSTDTIKNIYAPFQFFIDNAGIVSRLNGIFLSAVRDGAGQTEAEGPKATIETPWGDYSCPTRIGTAVQSASMTITVTAADPATRYG